MYKTTTYKSKLGVGNRRARLLWNVVCLVLFRPTPWFMNRWRLCLLRCFGAKIATTCVVHTRPACMPRGSSLWRRAPA